MSAYGSIQTFGEQIGFELCGLYRTYGYTQYRMSKFEEYDLYAGNKDFLVSDHVLTFTDLSGKLMALKPDVTLSIVHSSRDGVPGVQKVYYTENVYRAAAGGAGFREILQSGLECIGEIDDYCISEVLILAAESLRRISANSVLEISHLDILSEQLDGLGLSAEDRRNALKCIAGKNLHELAALCAASGANPVRAEALRQLVQLSGTPAEVLPRLEALGCAPAAVAQLRCVGESLQRCGAAAQLRIDFSLVNDMTYYNGIVFKGFVEGVPVGVVFGGQYDRLMEKMGRRSRAIGFAVYLDALERLDSAGPDYDADMVLLYDETADPAALSAAVKRLAGDGVCVTAQRAVPEKLKYRTLARLNGSEVEILAANA